VVSDSKPSRIVVGLTDRRSLLPFNELLDLRFRGVAIEESARAYETAFARISLKELRPSDLVFSSDLGPRPLNLSLQSIYCWIIALTAVVLTLPLMALVAILVRITSPGPALFQQVRVGKDDHPFTLFKFRSMRNDAEAGTGAVWAQRNDPRVTPLGKWLRKLRLDELPQLFNVLKGEMSIVGPRPERPEFVQKLEAEIPFYRQRHCVKPGITGWAQINHKYGDTLEDTITKLEYDLYYIKNMAPALDFYIMFQTAKVMLLSRGAQ
jgi:exopolysaccharide biosynthesis polyprenyl glycosylphosphotransferase